MEKTVASEAVLRYNIELEDDAAVPPLPENGGYYRDCYQRYTRKSTTPTRINPQEYHPWTSNSVMDLVNWHRTTIKMEPAVNIETCAEISSSPSLETKTIKVENNDSPSSVIDRCDGSLQKMFEHEHIDEVSSLCFGNNMMKTDTKEKPYECSVCSKCFLQKHNLTAHMRTHTTEKPYECDVCNKCFSRSGNLTKHMRTHTKEKPYGCDLCSKFFAENSSLTKHMRTHTNEKPYECNVCNKCFSESGSLSKHMRTHTNEKPYGCVVCNKRFSQKGRITEHMRTHTNEKPYECDVCHKCFSELQEQEFMVYDMNAEGSGYHSV
ncbi:Zinc finger protein 37 [Nymphon striatum]|nr:Zinc finger protein 37 [Nymphon striatum]